MIKNKLKYLLFGLIVSISGLISFEGTVIGLLVAILLAMDIKRI